MTHDESRNRTDDSRVHSNTAPVASVHNIEHSRLLPWIMSCCILAGFSCALGVFAIVESQRADREARMLQYYVLEMDAKLIAAGVKKPEEAVAHKPEK